MAAPAYRYRSSAQQQPVRRAYERPQRPDFRTVPGERDRRATRVLPEGTVKIAVILAVALILVTVAAFGRVYLSSQAIVTSIDSEEISSSIAQARSAGSTLEVQTSVVANSTTVKEKATELGMKDPTDVTYITLSEDVVAVNDDGSLSLTGSIEKASGSAIGE